MELVVDANILIAALIRDGSTRKLLIMKDHKFYIPNYLIEEINNHLLDLGKKKNIDSYLLIDILGEIISMADITIVSKKEFEDKLFYAAKICPDVGDIPYFALALKKGCPIWSNDKKLKEQDVVEIYTTKELLFV